MGGIAVAIPAQRMPTHPRLLTQSPDAASLPRSTPSGDSKLIYARDFNR